MVFWGHRFPPKNEWTNSILILWYLKSTCFHSFFGGNRWSQKTISKFTDLYDGIQYFEVINLKFHKCAHITTDTDDKATNEMSMSKHEWQLFWHLVSHLFSSKLDQFFSTMHHSFWFDQQTSKDTIQKPCTNWKKC